MRYSLYLEPDEGKTFKYILEIAGILDFHKARNWLTDTYGPCETLAHGDKVDNKHWTYHIVYHHYVLRIFDDEELSWFKLKYGEPN